MALLGRDDILDADDVDYEDVLCNEWRPTGTTEDSYVRVKQMTAEQCARIQGQMYEIYQAKKGYERVGEIALRTIYWCAIDENGERIFNSEADIKRLGKKSHRPIERLNAVIKRLSGMANSDAVEDAEEDFDDAPTSNSLSD